MTVCPHGHRVDGKNLGLNACQIAGLVLLAITIYRRLRAAS
jgi:hypothetical protein